VNYVSLAQYTIGAAIVLYGVALLAWNYVPRLAGIFGRGRKPPPDDDVRIVSDLATRLRSQGKTPAVQIALQLHAELLKPEGEK
jgi:hypothetical protein